MKAPYVFFDDEFHKYYIKGVEYPSVTEICDPISFKKLDALNKSLIERAAQRGRVIHEFISNFFIEQDESLVDEIPGDLVGYAYAFLNWYRTYKPTVLYSELLLGDDELGFCGTCDIIVVIDNKIILIDTKTTANLDKKYLSAQLSGYKQLLAKRGIFVDKTMALHLKKDQTWNFCEITPDDEWFSLLLKHNQKMRSKYGK